MGVHDAMPGVTTHLVPLADGGEGIVSVLCDAFDATVMNSDVAGPMHGQHVDAQWAYSEETATAIIEMASAAGLGLVPPERRNPCTTTTLGVGELIRIACEHGAKRLVIGLGGSATTAAGTGMARALGFRFLEANGVELEEGGASLSRLDSIMLPQPTPAFRFHEVIGICDVDNPLLGPDGASRMFAPQKGASEQDVECLERSLSRFALIVSSQMGQTVDSVPGAGAAGGMGAGLLVFLQAKLRPGIDVVFDAIHFDEALKSASLVITGEGRIDAQTAHGKVIHGVVSRARSMGIPVIAMAGSVEGDTVTVAGALGLTEIATLVNEKTNMDEAIAKPAVHLRQRTAETIRGLIAHDTMLK